MTICTHIKDGKPVTEVVEDGKVRPYDPEEFKKDPEDSASGTVQEGEGG